MAATTKARKTSPDPNETATDRFKRLGSGRVSKVIDGLKGISQLANANQYEYTDAQIDTIADALNKEVEATIVALRERKTPRGAKFSL